MGADGSVLVAQAGDVGLVRIHRPEARNALRRADKLLVADTLRRVAAEGVSAIVLTGSGDRAFCAGTDIKEMADLSADEGAAMLAAEADMFDAIMTVPVPVIAAVNGAALGAGCVLAYCCDLAIAAERATFGQPEVRNGVPAPVQAALLPRIVGVGRARWLMYTGDTLSASTARDWGLVGEVVDASHLIDRALEIGDRLAGLPGQGVALQKQIVDSWIRIPFDESVRGSVRIAAAAFESGEHQEAIKRFLERKR
jgi:enoyl-CoA hydratase/carnithine racemase